MSLSFSAPACRMSLAYVYINFARRGSWRRHCDGESLKRRPVWVTLWCGTFRYRLAARMLIALYGAQVSRCLCGMWVAYSEIIWQHRWLLMAQRQNVYTKMGDKHIRRTIRHLSYAAAAMNFLTIRAGIQAFSFILWRGSFGRAVGKYCYLQ